MILEYVGQKPLPYVVQTPIPLISRSERNGELQFNPTAEVPDLSWANHLLTQCGDTFRVVDGPREAATADKKPPKPTLDPLIYVGKRFSGKGGKWNAVAFIRKHHAEEILGIRKLKIFSKTIHWELVPIALADVKADDLRNTWNPAGGKRSVPQKPQEDSIAVATAGVLEPSIP